MLRNTGVSLTLTQMTVLDAGMAFGISREKSVKMDTYLNTSSLSFITICPSGHRTLEQGICEAQINRRVKTLPKQFTVVEVFPLGNVVLLIFPSRGYTNFETENWSQTRRIPRKFTGIILISDCGSLLFNVF